MGMLSQAALGGIQGGANTYLDIRKQERKDELSVAKEGRNMDIWEIQQKRLNETKRQMAGEQHARDVNKLEIASDLKKEVVSTSSGQDIYDLSGDKPELLVSNDDKESGKPWNSSKNLNKIDKWFRDEAKDQNKDSERAMTPEGTEMTDRTSTVASKVYRELKGTQNRNSIMAAVNQSLREDPSRSIDELTEDIKAYDNQMWLWADQKAEKKEKEIERSKAEKASYNVDTTRPKEILAGKKRKEGMLSRGTGKQDMVSIYQKMMNDGVDEAEALKAIRQRAPDFVPPKQTDKNQGKINKPNSGQLKEIEKELTLLKGRTDQASIKRRAELNHNKLRLN